MKFIKNDLKKDFIMPIKRNRKVALSLADTIFLRKRSAILFVSANRGGF
jgi:hypothetical protein